MPLAPAGSRPARCLPWAADLVRMNGAEKPQTEALSSHTSPPPPPAPGLRVSLQLTAHCSPDPGRGPDPARATPPSPPPFLRREIFLFCD